MSLYREGKRKVLAPKFGTPRYSRKKENVFWTDYPEGAVAKVGLYQLVADEVPDGGWARVVQEAGALSRNGINGDSALAFLDRVFPYTRSWYKSVHPSGKELDGPTVMARIHNMNRDNKAPRGCKHKLGGEYILNDELLCEVDRQLRNFRRKGKPVTREDARRIYRRAEIILEKKKNPSRLLGEE